MLEETRVDTPTPEEGVLLQQENGPSSEASSSTTRHNSETFSFASLNLFKDQFPFWPIKPKKYTGNLLKGPRKLFRICLVTLVIPVLLISTTLYIRQVLYPPFQYPMAPTDQRLLDKRTSTIWCQHQSVRMNGTFSAFLMPKKPRTRPTFSRHVMLKHMILKDDIKEYWGFFLQKGSIISLNLCTRYDGGMLMILRGVNNLNKCAWIGEEDSAEQDDKETSRESGEPPEIIQEDEITDSTNVNTLLGSGFKSIQTSEERRKELGFLIERIIGISKNENELTESFNKLKSYKTSNVSYAEKSTEVLPSNKAKREINFKSKTREDSQEKLKRNLENQKEDGAFEELEEDEDHQGKENTTNSSPDIKERYAKLFSLPEGLSFERGTINQSTGNDLSEEENDSSFSSSEEALINCEGVLAVVTLHPSRHCLGFSNTQINKITYKIPITGSYYFVFSSDNEVFDSEIYFNMTLQRVVFDTSNATNVCLNETKCSLPLSFWSQDQAVVEVPDGDWDDAYILEINCQPRVAVYLVILLMIPLAILICAFK